MIRFWLLAVLIVATLATPALADPCEGALPRTEGTTFSESVRYVGDGDSFCFGQTDNPSEWIEVRLADFDAPDLNADGGKAAKDMLVEVAFGQTTSCVAERGRSGRVVSYDRVIACCKIGDVFIGEALRKAGGQEGGE